MSSPMPAAPCPPSVTTPPSTGYQPPGSTFSARDWTDRFHYIPVSGTSFLSINGQLRERGEYQDHPAFGAQPPDNGYLLQRYLISADLHLTEHFRTFVQLDSGSIH